VIDEQSRLVFHHDVTTDAGDNRQLLPIAANAKQQQGVKILAVLADASDSTSEQIRLQKLNNTLALPHRIVLNSNLEFYQNADFTYEWRNNNEFRCPAGKILKTIPD